MSEAFAFNARIAHCGGCGAEMAFEVGSSRVKVCEYCSHAVVRTDAGFENIGKVADVIPTGARLALGVCGTYEGVGFRLAGRLQLAWEQGAWDEWHAAFDDGRWGWIAEAQGKYYVSFRVSQRAVPPLSALRPGRVLFLHGLGRYVVSEVRAARYAGARGELPEKFPLDGTLLHLADLSGPEGAFATLDYGDGSEPVPAIFGGREVSLEALHIQADAVLQPERARVRAKELTCPNCKAPVPLQVPDQAMRVTCTHCHSLLDASEGPLHALTTLQQPDFLWKLGSRCAFAGVELIVVGWMERECTVEGEKYTWEEYLLYNSKTASYRFLVVSNGHWSLVVTVPPGAVETGHGRATYKGRSFKVFSGVQATVRRVYGEFYWAVASGEMVSVVDYIAPPEGLSKESSENEVTWSHAVYLPPDEVWRAFGSKRPIREPAGVGALQPNPHQGTAASSMRVAFLACLAALVLFLVFSIRADNQVVLEQSVRYQPGQVLGEAAGATAPPPALGGANETSVAFSSSFEIPHSHRNLQVELDSDVANSWVWVAGALINETTGEVTELGLESSFYEGWDSDGHWVENERRASTFLSELPAGRYVLRTEAQWPRGARPPSVRLQLTSGVARGLHFLLVLVGLAVFPLIAVLRSGSFEHRRWEEATVER